MLRWGSPTAERPTLGLGVGLAVGLAVGLTVGLLVGDKVGLEVGLLVGLLVGDELGLQAPPPGQQGDHLLGLRPAMSDVSEETVLRRVLAD